MKTRSSKKKRSNQPLVYKLVSIVFIILFAMVGYHLLRSSHAASPTDADINGDHIVNGGDYSIIAKNWLKTGQTFATGDLNNDGTVNGGDYSVLAKYWLMSTTADTTPPTVAMQLPANGSTVSGTVTMTATASDDVGVTHVDFYQGTTTLIGSTTTSPYSVNWNTAGLANTSYSLTARAYDAAGNNTVSTAVSVTVSNVVSSGIWHPTADRPYTLHYMLSDTLNINDPIAMGLRDLNGNVLPAPDVYDIDGEFNTVATVDALHAMGKKVICYFDGGVWEDYRSDTSVFPGVQNEGKTYTGDPQYANVDIIGTADNGWPGSKWLDVRRIDILQPIMTARMQNLCKNKHFDGIDPDETTNWSNNPGFPITYNDQITYNKAIASWAHALGLGVGLKGDLEQAHDLVPYFDWTINEECFLYGECTTVNESGGPGADGNNYPGLQLFAQANKAVWVLEYPSEYPANQQSGTGLNAATFNSMCATSKTQHFNTALYLLGLPANGGRTPCPTTSATTW